MQENTGTILLFICFTIVLAAGCTNREAAPVIPTPQIVHSTILITPAQAVQTDMAASSTPYTTPSRLTSAANIADTPGVYLDSVKCSYGEYHRLYCTGYIVNNYPIDFPVTVSANIDVYDNSGEIKLDHMVIIKEVNAHGKTAFERTSTVTENYGNISFNYSIGRIY